VHRPTGGKRLDRPGYTSEKKGRRSAADGHFFPRPQPSGITNRASESGAATTLVLVTVDIRVPDTALLTIPARIPCPSALTVMLVTYGTQAREGRSPASARPAAGRQPRVRSAPSRLSRRRGKPEVSVRDRWERPHRAFGVHLSPRALRQAAVRPSQPVPGVQVSRPVGRRETPPTGRRKSDRLSLIPDVAGAHDEGSHANPRARAAPIQDRGSASKAMAPRARAERAGAAGYGSS